MIRERPWPLVVASAATAVLLLDTTVVYVGLPTIAADLGASFEQMQWAIDAYAVALAAVLLPAGSLADRLGRRRVLNLGLALFAVASAACGAATDGTQLDIARAAQGVGAAAVYAASLAVLAAAYEGAARARALTVWGIVSGAALAAGPVVGGVLIDGPGWRWIFLLNLPVAAACALAARRGVRESRDLDAPPADLAGGLLASAGLALLVAGILRGEADGWTSLPVTGALGGGAALLVLFVLVELRLRHPMLDPRLLRDGGVAGTAAVAFLQSVALYPAFLLLAVRLQDVDGYTPIETGIRVLPFTLALFLAAPVAGRLTGRVPLRRLLGAGLAVVTLGLLALRGAGAGDGWEGLLPGMLLLGAGSGILSPSLAAAMIAVLPADRAGLASGLGNTFRQAGIAAGVALIGAVMQAGFDAPFEIGSGAGEAAGPAAAAAFDSGLDPALAVAAGAAVAGIVAALFVTGRPAPRRA